MLPKSRRLNLKKDFKWVAGGKRLETKYLKLFLKFGDNQIPKLGIAVSSKVFNKATQRNEAKRIASFAFERLYDFLPNNINIVALPKVDINKVESKEVLLDLEEKLKIEQVLANRNEKVIN